MFLMLTVHVILGILTTDTQSHIINQIFTVDLPMVSPHTTHPLLIDPPTTTPCIMTTGDSGMTRITTRGRPATR